MPSSRYTKASSAQEYGDAVAHGPAARAWEFPFRAAFHELHRQHPGLVPNDSKHELLPSSLGTLIGDHPPCCTRRNLIAVSSTRLVDAGRWLDSSWRRNGVSNITIMIGETA